MVLPRVSLGGTQVRVRQSLCTFRHWTFNGEPGAPGFSAAASETGKEGKQEKSSLVSVLTWRASAMGLTWLPLDSSIWEGQQYRLLGGRFTVET